MHLFVGCSSREEIDSKYLKLASQVGILVSSYQVGIGGTEEGMMGKVAQEIPKDSFYQMVLKDYLDGTEEESDHFIICDTSFERMKKIWEFADVFLFLPGGTGTLAEILLFLEENRMKKKKKPILIFDYEDYYYDFKHFIKKAKENRFSNEDILEGIVFVSGFEELEKRLKEMEIG